MNVNLVIEPTHVIQRQILECYGSGPSSYDAVAGDPLLFGPTYYPSCVPSFISKSGNIRADAVPSITGNLRPAFSLQYSYSGRQGVLSVVQNVAGTGMTPGTTVPIVFSGGGGSGAAGTVTVLTATTISINLTSNGAGYTSAPTATISGTGGTPATLTAAAAPASGTVPSTTNLSTESFQFLVLGGEM